MLQAKKVSYTDCITVFIFCTLMCGGAPRVFIATS